MNIRIPFVQAVAVAALLLGSASAGQAWHAAGHMMTAAVAWDQMTPAARKRVAELLKMNPDYDSWVQGVADADKDKTAFVRASIWPDVIKSRKPEYKDDGEDPTDPNADANVGYSDKLMHKYWHYIDLPFAPPNQKVTLIQPKNPNAETRINKHRDTLSASGASDDLKSYDLVWLIHIVGDVHQPLHATSRFTKLLPQGDEGGNKVKIKCTPGCGSNLHSFWDGLFDSIEVQHDDAASAQAAIAAAAKLKKASGAPVANTDPHSWITESFAIAKKSAYRSPIGTTNKTFTLTASYKKAATAIGRDRIALGGARLAKLLNDAFKSSPISGLHFGPYASR
jgi:hypothetical protein